MRLAIEIVGNNINRRAENQSGLTELNLPPKIGNTMCFQELLKILKISKYFGHMLIWGVHFYFIFVQNSCNFQYFILGWPTLVRGLLQSERLRTL